MQTAFDTLIDSYIDDKVGIAENFLKVALANQLREKLAALHSQGQFQSAGTGNEKIILHDKLYRSDMIYWLDREHKDPVEEEFFTLMDLFVLHLNSTCYTGITGYEFHYAMYPAGSFYKKHLDQFRSDPSRQYSMIMYLNEDWQPGDGGELRIHHMDRLQDISPTNGKSIFFKSSELEHEVMLTNKPRLSITGWLKVG
ncbi:2OG-Fe(II) oxygenase [Dyadobacter sp. Leaf189]|uniref:2OG-Fe(II) oxygenase n=1 Tax=Dyadobacter sp. Leaf189 TaxID=1736295 RepID=UPI0006F2057B|nr:2OG-Fe(II) oxygenase [Dyadobacter sp. Leaf189]KQS27013.1 proline hydroxylase [Dyadobacter sp. Leaf189]